GDNGTRIMTTAQVTPVRIEQVPPSLRSVVFSNPRGCWSVCPWVNSFPVLLPPLVISGAPVTRGAVALSAPCDSVAAQVQRGAQSVSGAATPPGTDTHGNADGAASPREASQQLALLRHAACDGPGWHAESPRGRQRSPAALPPTS